MQVVFELACLPYEAFFSLDAIARTAGRMLFSHQRLLEWNPSGEADLENCRKTAKRGNSQFHELTASFVPCRAAPASPVRQGSSS